MLKELRVLMGFESNLPTLENAMMSGLVERIEQDIRESASSEANDVSKSAAAATKQAQFGTGTHRPGHSALHQDATAWHSRARDLHVAAKATHPEGSKEWAHHVAMERQHDKLISLHSRHVGDTAQTA